MYFTANYPGNDTAVFFLLVQFLYLEPLRALCCHSDCLRNRNNGMLVVLVTPVIMVLFS